MDKLRVRIYNVRFGDAILVIVPDADENGLPVTRHILIDVGNVPGGEGGADTVFEPVMEDVLATLDGRPLDLYVMTHEHMDHVQGLLYLARHRYGEEGLRDRLRTQHAWLTASAAPDYYQRHPDAQKKLNEDRAAYFAIAGFLQAAPEQSAPAVAALMAINDPGATADCVNYIRTLAGIEHTAYIYRGMDLRGKHPFRETNLEIWAPEEDTTVYYGQFHPMTLGTLPGDRVSASLKLTTLVPPAGVDAGAFYDLVESRRRGFADNLLAIDQAANNTSVVFCLGWRGWKLLFPGDAERRSWRTMNKANVLTAVDFLKIGHHGSANATPSLDLLKKILPTDGRRRYAALSTYPNTYNNVPDDGTLERLGERSDVRSVVGLPDGRYVEFAFDPDGQGVSVTTP
jgi:beta-lactamase superfamily II metal-dependent hydrolase